MKQRYLEGQIEKMSALIAASEAEIQARRTILANR